MRNQLILNAFGYIDLEILSKNKVIRLITVYKPPTIGGKRKEKEFIEEFGNYLDTINNLRTTLIFVVILIYGFIRLMNVTMLRNLLNFLKHIA